MRNDLPEQLPILGRISNVQAAAEHADHRHGGIQRAAQSHGIDSPRSSGDDNAAAGRNELGKLFCLQQTVGAAAPGSDNADHRFIINIRQAAAVIKERRGIRYIPQTRRIGGVCIGQKADFLIVAVRENLFRLIQRLVQNSLQPTPVEALGGQAVLLPELIDALRRAKQTQKRRTASEADSRPRRQPDPVLQHGRLSLS